MARSFNVLYRFLAKDSFSGVSKKIKTNNKKLASSFKQLDKSVTKSDTSFTRGSRSFVSGFQRMAAAGLAFFSVAKLFQAGMGMEDAMADLSAITGATGKDLANLKNETFALSRASVTSQVDVAKGLKLVASAKPELLKNLPALVKTTEAVLLLKNTGIDLESAVAATVGGLNAFGEGAEFASRNVNILAAGSKFGSSEVRDTAEALKLAGPGAKAAGLTFLDLNVAIQALAKAGIKGSQGGTALNAMFARLQLSGKDFRELGLGGVFKEVKTQIDAIKDPTERATAQFELFGLEHAKSGLAMLDNIPVIDTLSVSMKGTDAAAEQAGIRLKTLSKSIALAGIILDEKLIKTFDLAKSGSIALGSAITGFMDSLDPADLEVFGLVLSGLGTLLAGLARIFTVVFTVIMSVIKPVFAVLKGIGIAIGQVIAAITTMDFSNFDFGGAFDIGGKFLGLFGDDAPSTGTPVGQDSKSTTDINMNINAPDGTVESVQSTTTGRGTNVGLNMAGG